MCSVTITALPKSALDLGNGWHNLHDTHVLRNKVDGTALLGRKLFRYTLLNHSLLGLDPNWAVGNSPTMRRWQMTRSALPAANVSLGQMGAALGAAALPYLALQALKEVNGGGDGASSTPTAEVACISHAVSALSSSRRRHLRLRQLAQC
ncbi:MAG: hypothetical protein FRX49_11700 [Trebouxia sp. A1-2]|nr:MAG: hypothetical protein FRX49_11700 [Trebouxia sp. A1-2]